MHAVMAMLQENLQNATSTLMFGLQGNRRHASRATVVEAVPIIAVDPASRVAQFGHLASLPAETQGAPGHHGTGVASPDAQGGLPHAASANVTFDVKRAVESQLRVWFDIIVMLPKP